MTKRKIDFRDYANAVTKAVPDKILLTSRKEKVNTVIIGWFTIGVNWWKPVFAGYIREGRFTRKQLADNPDFTISIPVGEYDPQFVRVCESKSERDINKIKEAGLTLVNPEVISVLAFREFPSRWSARWCMSRNRNLTALSEEINRKMYPHNVDSTSTDANKNPHITFFGEIVDAYIIEE